MKSDIKNAGRAAHLIIELTPQADQEPRDTDHICSYCGVITTDPDRARYACHSCREYKGWMTIGEAKALGYYTNDEL